MNHLVTSGPTSGKRIAAGARAPSGSNDLSIVESLLVFVPRYPSDAT